MTWATVKTILALLPEIISLVKSCFVWVDGEIDLIQTRYRAKEMLQAITKAKETGDTSDVEAIFNPPLHPRS